MEADSSLLPRMDGRASQFCFHAKVDATRLSWQLLLRDTPQAMSGENVNIVRRIYDEGLIDSDPEDWLLELAAAEIEYVNPPYAVEPGVRRGPGEVVRAMRGFAEVWQNSRHELHELFDCGDSVVAAVSWYTRSRGSDSELVQEEAHTWGLRKGRITRFEWGKDLEAALQAAGLRE